MHPHRYIRGCAKTYLFIIVGRVRTSVTPRTHPHLTVGMEVNVSLELVSTIVKILGHVVSDFFRKWSRAGIYVTAGPV